MSHCYIDLLHLENKIVRHGLKLNLHTTFRIHPVQLHHESMGHHVALDQADMELGHKNELFHSSL